ncbi:MAG: AAA family ATPase [Limisphaerales bacterium]
MLMNPQELHQTLSQLIAAESQRSVMIWGPPGVGKSSIVGQVATENDLLLTDLRLSQLAPTDLRGLPVADGDRSRWLPPEFLPEEGRGILFLDELNMAPPALQGIAQQLILDRRVGSYCVPPGWHVWAAGNRKEDRASVFDMPAPLANRFLHFTVEPHWESFRSWAARCGLHEQVMAFVAFRPSLLHQPDGNAPAWPSCRSWEMASELHDVGMGIAPAVGEGTAAEFNAFTDVCQSLPDLDVILAGDGQYIEFPEEPSLRYAASIGLGVRGTGAEAVTHGFRWLLEKAGAEWCQLYIHTVRDRASTNGQTGLLATLLKEDVRMRDFLGELMAA